MPQADTRHSGSPEARVPSLRVNEASTLFLPQFYLRGFAETATLNTGSPRVWVLRIGQLAAFRTSLQHIGLEKDFYADEAAPDCDRTNGV